MKYFLAAILTVLTLLPDEQLLANGSPTGCPRRYLRRINGKCYYFSVKKMNWFGALNNCLRKGLTLADLSNPGDFNAAVDFLSSKGNTEDFWFGGNDLQTEGRFQYISSGRLVRYFSNISIVEPAVHSECDDCLEVRIRPNITVVADDNCLERQYFICSEIYCDEVLSKPRHHSHEHLHHFHHDIGEPSDEKMAELNTPSPFDVVEDEDKNVDSEEATIRDDGAHKQEPENAEGENEEGEQAEGEGGNAEEAAAEEETEAPPEEEAEAPPEGEAEAPPEGEAEAPPEEEAAAPPEGEAEAPPEGEAEAPPEGEA
ncbi:hypothetical protein KR222_003409, partial [Zaprionus bogoriensis]